MTPRTAIHETVHALSQQGFGQSEIARCLHISRQRVWGILHWEQVRRARDDRYALRLWGFAPQTEEKTN